AHRGTAAAAHTSASMRRSTVMRSRATDGRSASKCQGDGQIRPSTKRSGCPRVPVGVRTSRLSSRETGKVLIFTPVRESSGECRHTNPSGRCSVEPEIQLAKFLAEKALLAIGGAVYRSKICEAPDQQSDFMGFFCKSLGTVTGGAKAAWQQDVTKRLAGIQKQLEDVISRLDVLNKGVTE